jgi:hypothetical protein
VEKRAAGGAQPVVPDGQRVGQLVRQALRQAERSADDLAAAIQVPPEYVHDLITGRRRPPLPGRTDVYDRMASFLRLGRHALEACALAERSAAAAAPAPGSSSEVAAALLALCEPETARELKRRAARDGGAELARLTERLLGLVQGMVRRVLDDQVGLRLAAAERGMTYVELRVRLLEFLDGAPDTLTLTDLSEHVVPRVARWDVDLDTDVLRLVLRTHEPQNRGRRRPHVRHGYHTSD